MATTIYRVGIGHNLLLGDLAVITPQCRSIGVQRTRRSFAADGSIYQDAAFVLLIFSTLGNANQYGTLLNQFGLVSGLTSNVTLLCRNEFWADTLYNGTACQPDQGHDATYEWFPKNIEILVRDLVPVT